VSPFDVSYDIVKFDLELQMSEAQDRIVGELRYSTALFDRSTMERHVGYLEVMLKSMANNATQPFSTIELLAPMERDLVLHTWNATDAPYPGHVCIHRIFEEHVKCTPAAIAVVHEDRALSYADLDVRANQLAHQLIDRGVQPGDYVATLLNRSFELVIAQMAILKAGAAYVPLDSKAPIDRLAYIVTDSGAVLLITYDHVDIPTGIHAPILRFSSTDAMEEIKIDTEGLRLNSRRSSNDPAYVMYTSGSTGQPKGVIVPHRGIARLVTNNGYADIGVEDRVAFAGNPAFDASTFE
ncbi:hypothetical protein CPB97_005677, partial [Podila verticillata]